MSNQDYIIKTPIKGVDIAVGKTIELDPDDRDTHALLACGAVVPADEEQAALPTRPEEADALQQAITDAIHAMLRDDPDKANDSFWRKDGMPEVKVLEQRLGYDISAKERNTAWAAMSTD